MAGEFVVFHFVGAKTLGRCWKKRVHT